MTDFPEGKDETTAYTSERRSVPCRESAEYMEKLKEKALSEKGGKNDGRPNG